MGFWFLNFFCSLFSGLQGRGWRVGEVRAKLAEMIEKHKSVPKKPAYTYQGPPFGWSPFSLNAIQVGRPPRHGPRLLNCPLTALGSKPCIMLAILSTPCAEEKSRHKTVSLMSPLVGTDLVSVAQFAIAILVLVCISLERCGAVGA